MFDKGPRPDERRAEEPDPKTRRMQRRARRRGATARMADALLSLPASAAFRLGG